MPSQDELKRIFRYDDGALFWLVCAGRKHAGSPVGNGARTRGRQCIRYQGHSFLVHRVIWVMFNGVIPDGMEIDHVDHDPYNNRIENLRLVTHRQNMRNRSRARNNTSGYSGVTFDKNTSKWIAQISFRDDTGKRRTISRAGFSTPATAHDVRQKLLEQHGFHPNHGRMLQ